MGKITFLLSIIATFMFADVNAQSNVYYVAGGGSSLGDGGPASAASLSGPEGICFDTAGNMYIADCGHERVRKVNTAGIITTIAGNGTGGYSGDSGLATTVALDFYGIGCDRAGNIYIGDWGNGRVRKVDVATGILTTIAGGGTGGDGGLATAAELNLPINACTDAANNVYICEYGAGRIRKIDATTGIITTIDSTAGSPCQLAIDNIGNIFIADQDGYIRKIDASGTETIVAGGGSSVSSGIPATSFYLYGPEAVAVDNEGNFYIADNDNQLIEKVDAYGIITIIAGGGSTAVTYAGVPALSASFHNEMLNFDNSGNLFCTDGGSYAYKISDVSSPSYTADSFSVYLNNICSGLQFSIVTNSYSAGQHVVTYFGDGSSLDTIVSAYGTGGMVNFTEPYTTSGTYTIKNVLYDGASAVDSITYSYAFSLCNVFPVSFYYDANSDCIFDAGDNAISIPVLTEVDSNGVAIDTISAISGLYYTAYGSPGDVYTFRLIGNPGNLVATCPSSGIITDTIRAVANSVSTQYMGFQCPASSGGFDLSVTDVIPVTGEHDEWGDIFVNNLYSCDSIGATVTLHFSQKYVPYSSSRGLDIHPTPTSYTDSTITWYIAPMTQSAGTPVDLYYAIWANPAIGTLTAGDTVHTYVTVTPYAGDIDTVNNYCQIIDTVKDGCDPNEMSVQPSGFIVPTVVIPLQYTINFTNTGNDTAYNIYIMDTLSNNVDISTFRMVLASAPMNITMLKSGGHNIIKFDFPGINLQDSAAAPAKCSGAVIFNINTISGLPIGATVLNHAGIFFDYNPVVMTNTVEDTVVPPITISASADTICYGSPVTFTATTIAAINNPFYQWRVNSVISGAGSASFTTDSLHNLDTVICYLTSTTGDTLYFASNAIVMNVTYSPDAGTITGASTICIGTPQTLSDPAGGGVWTATNGNATVSGGIVSAVALGADTISYHVTNWCGSNTATYTITINSLPSVSPITGSYTVCAGNTILLADTTTGGTWAASNANATVSGGSVTGIAGGSDSILYALTNTCGTATAAQTVTIFPSPDAGFITGGASICTGSATTLSDTASGGSWSASNGNATIAAGILTGVTPGTDSITYTVTNSCGTATVSEVVTVDVTPYAGNITGRDSVCIDSVITLIDSATGGVWSSSDTSIAKASGSVIMGVSPGVVTINYTVSNACGISGTESGYIYVVDCDLGIGNLGIGNLELVNIYPNPAHNNLTIQTDGTTYNTYSITNTLGVVLLQQSINSSITTVDIKGLPAGMYFVTLTGDNGSVVRKVVKE